MTEQTQVWGDKWQMTVTKVQAGWNQFIANLFQGKDVVKASVNDAIKAAADAQLLLDELSSGLATFPYIGYPVEFDADSLEMIGVTHKGFLYEADGEDGKVQIASMDLLEEGTVSTLEKCASIGRFVDTIDGVSTDVHVYMYGDEFADRNQTNDFIMYEACLRSSKNVLQDVIDYLEGREPENKSYYSLDEIAAEYDLVYFREENL